MIPKCNSCGQDMIEVGGTGKKIIIEQWKDIPGSDYSGLLQTGVREQKLYQCPECKDIKLD